jgi:aspartate 1-decarboxylase
MLKSKIHRAVITQTDVDYIGSITLDPTLMEAAGILPYEQVQVLNLANGNRLATYAIQGKKGSGQVCLNGAAALLANTGDLVIILSFGMVEDAQASLQRPVVVFVGPKNHITRVEREEQAGTRFSARPPRRPLRRRTKA